MEYFVQGALFGLGAIFVTTIVLIIIAMSLPKPK